MTDIIPASLRPSDVDLNTCTSAEQALRLLLWLKDVARDMDQQIEDRGKHDQHWLLKVRAAMRATSNLAHRTTEKLDGFKGEFSMAEAVLAAILDDENLRAPVLEKVSEKYPHLAVVISAFDPVEA